MPIYEYVCSNCQKVTDTLQKMNDPPPEACPACGAKGTLSRVVSRTSFVLKGGGWYADLYGSSKKAPDGAAPSGDGAKTAAPAGQTAEKSEASPAAAPAPAAPTSAPAPAAAGTKSDKSGG